MDPRRLVRLTSFVEAVSYLLLVGVAMPLKHFWGEPMLVRVLGMAHGVLFLLLIWFLLRVRIERGWPTSRVLLVAGAALVPIWPFLLDRRLRQWQAEAVGDQRAR